MSQYIQVEFENVMQEQSDILVACLSEIGYDGFEETEKNLKAFIAESFFDELLLNDIARQNKATFSKTLIQETNWNQLWESNFPPVVIDDFVAIRADFHQPFKDVKFEIVITPKMSFGTGHHATTYLMLQQMEQLNFAGKKILDFGTGTGVLAVLAEKLGSEKVIAIDNDKWSIENAGENIRQNSCSKIDLLLADTPDLQDSFDIILANINRNVILDNFPGLVRQIIPGGNLLISGLLVDDENDITDAASKLNLKIAFKAVKDNWLLLNLSP